VQYLVIGASGGTFTLSNAKSAVSGIAWNAALATLQTDLDTLLGGGKVSVRCASGGATCAGGPFQIVYNLGTVAGTDVPLIAVDSSKLTNANNLVQIVTVPAGTGDFWLSFVNATNGIELTAKISAGITPGGLSSKLAVLPSLTSHIHLGRPRRR